MLLTEPITHIDQDLFDREEFVHRLIAIILNPNTTTKIVGIYARWGSGKTSVLNLSKNLATSPEYLEQDSISRAFWVSSFQTWQMESIGDLRISLLWHLRNQLPKSLINNESILYRLGRVGVALSVVGLNVAGKFLGTSSLGTDAIKGLEAADEVKPIGDTITTSQSFAAAEQAANVTSAFDSLGQAICDHMKVDKVVVPIDDMDRCRPEHAVSLLFSLKNLLRSDRFRFVVAMDRHAMARFLTLNYGEQFSLEDANWFLEKIFDDWVDIPPPALDRLPEQIRFPSVFGPDSKQLFLERVAQSGLTNFAGNPRRFLRGCQRFQRFLSGRYEGKTSDLPDVSKLLSNFGWCVLYGGFPEQFDALLSARGMGTAQSDFETVITLCHSIRELSSIHGDSDDAEDAWKALLKVVSSAVDGVGIDMMGFKIPPRSGLKRAQVTRTELLTLLPAELKRYAEDYNSALMRFIGLMSRDQEPGELSECLCEVLAYL